MGFWQGINEGLTYVLDQKAAEASEEKAYAFKREEYQQTLLAQRQERYLERLAQKVEKEDSMKAQVGAAISLGLTGKTAVALQNTGQLSLFLDQYDKNKKVDPKFVEDLNLTVSKYLEEADDETISTAMINGVSTERDTTNPEESATALVEAIYSATTPEQLDEISQKVYAPTESTAMEPFKLDFGYTSGPEETETKNIRNEIASALQVQFKDAFTVNERTGDLTVSQNADRSVANLFAMAEERARELAFGPERSLSPTDAAAFVSGQIRTAVTVGNVGAQALVDNFDTVLTDPKTFAETFVQPAPVVPVAQVNPTETEAEVGQLGNALADAPFGSIVDELGRPIQ